MYMIFLKIVLFKIYLKKIFSTFDQKPYQVPKTYFFSKLLMYISKHLNTIGKFLSSFIYVIPKNFFFSNTLPLQRLLPRFHGKELHHDLILLSRWNCNLFWTDLEDIFMIRNTERNFQVYVAEVLQGNGVPGCLSDCRLQLNHFQVLGDVQSSHAHYSLQVDRSEGWDVGSGRVYVNVDPCCHFIRWILSQSCLCGGKKSMLQHGIIYLYIHVYLVNIQIQY